MEGQKLDDIDKLIQEEKRLLSRELFLEAWERAMDDGVDPVTAAQIFVDSALCELASARGDGEAVRLASSVGRMAEGGEFLLDKTIQ